MHFHLPKPLHGWREFAGEVGIIVLGVIIALAFEAFVDEMNWRSKVAEARREIRYEVGHNLALVDDRVSAGGCVDRKINQLATIITRATVSGHLPPLGRIGRPRAYTWPEAVWDSQVAAQTMTHFPAEKTAAISRAYRLISALHDANRAEEDAWVGLSSMEGPGRPIDAATISQLIDKLEIARVRNRFYQLGREEIERVLVRGGLGSNFAQLDPNNPPVLPTNSASICADIGQAPATY